MAGFKRGAGAEGRALIRFGARRQGGLDALAAAGACRIGFAIDREHFGGVVQHDLLTLKSIGHHVATQQAQFCAAAEQQGIGLAVVDG